MPDDIRRELKRLKVYALIVTALLGTMSLAAFRQATQKARFTEIDVERINIVEPDGHTHPIALMSCELGKLCVLDGNAP